MRWLATGPTEEWEQRDDPRVAAVLAGVNLLAFLAAQLLGLTDVLGVCLAASLLMLTAGYVVWERNRRRTAIALAVGTLPFWVMLAMVF